ncbi:MAG: hypothetical protein EXS09_18125 [Gemmataceae bacterium]|nr:hypothetical protein [Gemmataceae bacterium]
MSNAEPRWDRPILLGGAPRSGLTPLGAILGSHPNAMCGPAISLFSHPYFWAGEGVEWATRLHHLLNPNIDEHNEAVFDWDGGRGFVPYLPAVDELALEWYQVDVHQIRGSLMAGLHPQEAVRTIMSPRLRVSRKSVWSERSPGNVYGMKSFLKRYPEGRGIVVVRDGRDVVSSLVQQGWNFWRAAATWLVEAAIGMSLSRDRRIHVLKYEEIVADASAVSKKMGEFLELPDAIGRQVPPGDAHTSSVARWKRELSPLQLGMLATGTVIRNVPGLEEIGGVSFPEALRFFGYDDLTSPNLPLSEGELLSYAHTLAAPGFPVPFPMTHVDFPSMSGGRQLVGGMLYWIWGQIQVLSLKNKELEAQLEGLRTDKSKLEFKLQRKSGRVGALRELSGKNKELDAS